MGPRRQAPSGLAARAAAVAVLFAHALAGRAGAAAVQRSPMHGTSKEDRLMPTLGCYEENKLPKPSIGSEAEFCNALEHELSKIAAIKSEDAFDEKCKELAGPVVCRDQCRWLMSLYSDGPWTNSISKDYFLTTEDCVFCLKSRGARCSQPR